MTTTDQERIDEVMQQIKDHTGLNIILCDHFTGIRNYATREGFNVILNEDICASREYGVLERLTKTGIISGIESNGVRRVVLYF